MTLEEFARHGLALLRDSTLKSLVLLAVVGLALLCLRRASAAVRHLVLLLALVGLLSLPLFSGTLPGWRVAVWPKAMTSIAPPAGALSNLSAPAAVPGLPAPSALPSAASLPPIMPPAAMPVRPAHRPFSWPLLCLGLWALGACAVLGSVLAGLLCVRRIGQRSLAVESDEITDLAGQLLKQLNMRRAVSLRQSAASGTAAMPMTWGWRHPVVLLPAESMEWSEERLRVVLLHEFAHIRRSDWLWQMLAHLACAAYWFHPGVWLVARQQRIESERSCDDQVLAAGVPATEYARNLVEVARSLSRAQALPRGALPMATSQVEERVRAIIQSRRRRGMVTKRIKFAIVIASAALLLPLAMLRPAARAQAASASLSAADRAKANAHVSAVHAVPGESDAQKLEEQGSKLTADQAGESTRQLAADPDNLELHIKALGYYGQPSLRFTTLSNPLLDEQILWLIRNHPDNVLCASPDIWINPKQDGAAFTEAKNLWLSYAKQAVPSASILANGASFLTLHDFADAELLYLKAEAVEPKNPKWPNQLGHLYQLQESGRAGLKPDYAAFASKALAQYELTAKLDPDHADLSSMAKAAFDAGQYAQARQLANKLLQQAQSKTAWNREDDLHYGHLILGRLALRDGNVEEAKAQLLAMGQIDGSPVLSSFGPNMQLAQDLLQHGERQVVLEYLDECGKFWKSDHGQLDKWRAEIKKGQTPQFGGNLWY